MFYVSLLYLFRLTFSFWSLPGIVTKKGTVVLKSCVFPFFVCPPLDPSSIGDDPSLFLMPLLFVDVGVPLGIFVNVGKCEPCGNREAVIKICVADSHVLS